MSIQEAVHMVDNQELVISSDKITYLSLAQGQALRDECDMHAKMNLIQLAKDFFFLGNPQWSFKS